MKRMGFSSLSLRLIESDDDDDDDDDVDGKSSIILHMVVQTSKLGRLDAVPSFSFPLSLSHVPSVLPALCSPSPERGRKVGQAWATWADQRRQGTSLQLQTIQTWLLLRPIHQSPLICSCSCTSPPPPPHKDTSGSYLVAAKYLWASAPSEAERALIPMWRSSCYLKLSQPGVTTP